MALQISYTDRRGVANTEAYVRIERFECNEKYELSEYFE